MKKMLFVMLLILPLVGCASITSYLTPGDMPRDSMNFVGMTNVSKSAFFGLYSNKDDVESLELMVQNKHRRNVLEFQQRADREGLEFQIALGVVTDSLNNAAVLERETVSPVVNWGIGAVTGLLGLGAGARFVKRKGDYSPEEKDKEVLTAGLMQPSEFKKTISKP